MSVQCYLALPFVATFTAGAIAGISEILTFYPLGALPIFFLNELIIDLWFA